MKNPAEMRRPARRRARFAEQGGQVMLVWGLFGLIVCLLLAVGVMGTAQAFAAKAATQAAADAASLGATTWARPVYQIEVTRHTQDCFTVNGTGSNPPRLDCTDSPLPAVPLQGKISQLFRNPGSGGQPGWVSGAGCNVSPNDPSQPGSWIVCTAWQRTGFTWTYTDPNTARQAALGYLATNLAGDAGQDTWQMSGFSVEQGSGRAAVTVVLGVRGDPLAALLGHAVSVTVTSDSVPVLPPGLASSGS